MSNAEVIFLIVGGAAVAFAIAFLWRRIGFLSRRSESPVPAGIESLSLPDVPSDLIDACATGKCVLYGGAGLSIESGFPTRSEFVKGLVDWAHNAKLISQDEAASYRVEVDRGQGDAVADSLVSRLTTSDQQFALTSYLQSIFLKRARPSELHTQLKGINFSAILTTNLDTLLETTFGAKDDQVYTPGDSESLLSAMTRQAFFILKLYGKLSEPGAVVVAPGQYGRSTSGNTLFSDFMKTLFLSRTLLFVGSSVEGIEDYLRSLTQGREIAPGRTHYALVAVTDRAWRARAELLELRFGIKVLPYTGDHGQLSQFLNKLKEALPAKEALPQASPEAVSRLKRITLANIGPFENLTIDLDLDFKPAWHIFLGDNGVGKSTVIKAIALALCGKDAQPYASRFLRDNGTKNTTSEELTGTITLETNTNKTYVTTIRRDKKGDVELISSTAKPLEAEGWLALGFPPLRTTSWEGPKGPDADINRKSRPVVSDLLPLVAGDVDPRLDKLKQWVVNLDYLGSKSKGSERNHAAPIQKVFDIIGSVAEGMKLTYKGVGDGNRILVETEDGKPIPLENLSQGTISLIGWIGIFLQRLYEVFDEDEDPTKRYALILMDEIDAHMHPRWQRTLVTHLKELFPNAQFIATTHSPLVVSGLPARQVVRFAKDAAGNTTIIPIAPDMTTGYSDQILTSLLFDLPTTLDDTTEKMMEDYLVKKDDPTADENEREDLRQELMTRVPPRTATYEEKHEQMVSRAKLLQEAGEKLSQLSPDAGRTILARADRLMSNLKPGANNDSD